MPGARVSASQPNPLALALQKRHADWDDIMVLIQLLLPSQRTDDASNAEAIALTRSELVQRFGGVTAFLRSPARGAWTSPEGRVEHDDVVMVEVVARAFDREWWRSYAGALERRFTQEAILIRAMEITVLDKSLAASPRPR